MRRRGDSEHAQSADIVSVKGCIERFVAQTGHPQAAKISCVDAAPCSSTLADEHAVCGQVVIVHGDLQRIEDEGVYVAGRWPSCIEISAAARLTATAMGDDQAEGTWS
jgi:hypothetical protein